MTALHAGPTIGTQMLAALNRYPDRTAFASGGSKLSYRATGDLLGRLQATFAKHGLRRGNRIALLSANRPEAWCAGVAAQALGLSITWLHPLGSLSDQLDQLADAEADGVVLDPVNFGQRAGEIASSSGINLVFTLGPSSYGVDLLRAVEEAGAATFRDFADTSDIALLNYTGGTTGRSKGAMRRHPSLTAVTNSALADFEFPLLPRFLAVAPVSHVAGSKILPTLLRGGTVHMMHGFDPERIFATVEREWINFTLLVPTMIYALLDHPGLDRADLSSLELLLYGASPMSPSRLLEGIDRIGPVFSQLYGQTECYPIAVLPKADHDRKRPELFSACGFPVASCTVKLLDDDDNEVQAGEPGEICVRGAQIMEEYWRRPAETEATLKNGWLHTGDIACADHEGRLFIIDRKKDMIVTGGVNVFPREIEDVLTTHEGVSMAAVIGVPDSKWGEAVKALVVRRKDADIRSDDLISLVKRVKGAAHTPKSIEFVDQLPLTAIGKVDKKVLRQKFWAGQERQVG